MTDQQIQETIDALNAGSHTDTIFLQPLTKLIDFSKYWLKIPHPEMNINSGSGPYSMYFIKNSKGRYVAAVLDMCHDLHWFVDPAFRGEGHLTAAMRETILPHLFLDRDEQTITIDTYRLTEKQIDASQHVAYALGFKMIGGVERGVCYQLESKNVKKKFKKKVSPSGISEERLAHLKKKINFLSKSLWMIQSEVEMAFDNEIYAAQLLQIVQELEKHIWKIEDRFFEHQGNF